MMVLVVADAVAAREPARALRIAYRAAGARRRDRSRKEGQREASIGEALDGMVVVVVPRRTCTVAKELFAKDDFVAWCMPQLGDGVGARCTAWNDDAY